jgi:hypothetical protein
MKIIFEQRLSHADGASGWFPRFMGLARVLGGILLLTLLHTPVQAAQSVTLAWDPNPETDVGGYMVYHGTASRNYTNAVNVRNVTTNTVSGLVNGVTYFFAVTAYNTNGLESDFSDEVRYSVPGALARLEIRVAANGQVVLTVTGQIGHSYDLLVTQALTAWTVLGSVTLGASGSREFVDLNAASFPARLYRTREQP